MLECGCDNSVAPLTISQPTQEEYTRLRGGGWIPAAEDRSRGTGHGHRVPAGGERRAAPSTSLSNSESLPPRAHRLPSRPAGPSPMPRPPYTLHIHFCSPPRRRRGWSHSRYVLVVSSSDREQEEDGRAGGQGPDAHPRDEPLSPRQTVRRESRLHRRGEVSGMGR